MNWNELFNYKDGFIFRKSNELIAVGNRTSSGYLRTNVMGKEFRVYRIIWEMHFGEIPAGMEIDHVNGSKADNRIENLRLATRSQNQANQKCPQSNNKNSGLRGVAWNKRSGKWAARVYQNRKEIHLGVFKCKFEAARAAEKKRIELFGQFAGCDLHPLPGGG